MNEVEIEREFKASVCEGVEVVSEGLDGLIRFTAEHTENPEKP